jgi:hypothetical protein
MTSRKKNSEVAWSTSQSITFNHQRRWFRKHALPFINYDGIDYKWCHSRKRRQTLGLDCVVLFATAALMHLQRRTIKTFVSENKKKNQTPYQRNSCWIPTWKIIFLTFYYNATNKIFPEVDKTHIFVLWYCRNFLLDFILRADWSFPVPDS